MVARSARLAWRCMGLAAIACGGGAERAGPASPVDSTAPAAAQVAFGVRHALTTGGVRRAELRADTALFSDTTPDIELRRVRLVLYSAAGDSVGVLAAPVATYDLRARRVAAQGGVTLLVGGRRTSGARALYDVASARVEPMGSAPALQRDSAAPRRP